MLLLTRKPMQDSPASEQDSSSSVRALVLACSSFALEQGTKAGKKRHNEEMEKPEKGNNDSKPRSAKKRRTEPVVDNQSLRAAMRKNNKSPWAVRCTHFVLAWTRGPAGWLAPANPRHVKG